MKKKYIFLSIGVLLLFSILFVYLYCQNNMLVLTSYQIRSERIKENFNNYKIIQISDFHNVKSKYLQRSIIKSLKDEKPDLIVITGDVIDSNRTDINVTLDFIDNVKNIAPIYYVNGNHESRINDYDILKNGLVKFGVQVLSNDLVEINVHDDTIYLMGVNDPMMLHNSSMSESDILNKEVSSINRTNEYFTILLSHRPEHLNVYVNNNIDLVFTGHAHGGQIRIPFIGGVVAPNQGLFPKYTSGIHKKNETQMIISRGIGNSVLPFRINNRPELVIVTLNSVS